MFGMNKYILGFGISINLVICFAFLGTKSLNELEEPCSDIGQDADKQTLTETSQTVDKECKIEGTNLTVISNISPEELELPSKADKFSLASEKKLGYDDTNESESTESDLVKSSKSLETEVAKDVCKEDLNESVETHLSEVDVYPEDAQDPESSLLLVESVKAQKEDLLSGPGYEIQNKTECDEDAILKELEVDRVSEECQSSQEKAVSLGESAVAVGIKIKAEETVEKSKQQILIAESPGTSFEEATLETENGVKTVLAGEFPEEKSVGSSTDKVEEKERLGKDSGTAEDKAASEFSLKVEEKRFTSAEVSDTSEVGEPFSESCVKEGKNLIQEKLQILTKHENSHDSTFPSCGESVKAAEEKNLSLEEHSQVISDKPNESSEPDKQLSHVKLEESEPGTVDLVLATQAQEELIEGDPLWKEFEELSQELIVQEVISEGNELQKELAQEKLAEKEQLQEELVEEKKQYGEPLLEHKEPLQETLPLESSKPAEKEELLADTLRALENKNSLEVIVKAHSDENDTLDKSLALLDKSFCDVEPDFGASFHSEAVKTTPAAEGLLFSDFSSLENATELKVALEVELASSPVECSLTDSLKHATTSSGNKEASLFEAIYASPCIISDTDREITYDNSYGSGVVSDSGTLNRAFFVGSSVASEFSLSVSEPTDPATDSCSFETGKLDTAFTTESPCLDIGTDHLAGGNLFQEADKALQEFDHGAPDSSLNRQSINISYTEPIVVTSQGTECEHAVELQENIAFKGEEIVKSAENSTELLSKKSASPCIISDTDRDITYDNSDGSSVVSDSGTLNQAYSPSISESTDLATDSCSFEAQVSSDSTDIGDVRIAVEQGIEISGLKDIQECSNIPEIPAKESSEETLSKDRTLDSQKFRDILAKERGQEHQKIRKISEEQKTGELENIIFGEEISQEISLEKSHQELRQVPDILDPEICQKPHEVLEISAEKDSPEFHEARKKIGDDDISRVPQDYLETSLEPYSEELQQFPAIFCEKISRVPQEVLENNLKSSLEKNNQELQQERDILGEQISLVSEQVQKSPLEENNQEFRQKPDIFGEQISPVSEQVQKSSLEQNNQELQQESDILGEQVSPVSEQVQKSSLEENNQELQQEPDILGEQISRVSEQIQKSSVEENNQEVQQEPDILGEQISPVSEQVQKSSLEENNQELQQEPDILGEQISPVSEQVQKSSLEENIQELPLEPDILGEQISSVSEQVQKSSVEENNQDLLQQPEILGEQISPVSEEVQKGSLEESNQELEQDPDRFGKEISQGHKEVLQISVEEDIEPYQIPGISSQAPIKVLDISAEEHHQEPEKDKVFSENRFKLLVHQLEMTAQSQVRFLMLNLDENNESQVFRLERGWTLQFLLGPTLANTTVRVFVNHPLQGVIWDKNSYRELEWGHLPSLQLDVCEGHADVTMIQAGSFHYYFTLDGSDCKEHANGCGYFLVDPDLAIGKSFEKLPLDGIICQTVLSKLLGPFPEWEGRLRVAKETGYNVIHFTPVQELGASNSAYALRDQLKLNPVFHTSNRTFGFEDVKRLVEVLNSEYDLLSFTDLVLNHTANESPWISEHPECVFNLANSPHLKPAYLLDRRLRMFSVEVADGVWESEGIPPMLNSESHLERIAMILHTSVLPELRLAEFYQVSVDEVLNSFRNLVVGGFIGGDNNESELRIIPDPNYRRLQSTVNISVAIKLFYSSQTSDITVDEQIELAVDVLRRELERLNARADSVVSEHLLTAVANFVANARYRFVDANGLRLSAVTREQPIMNRLVTHLCILIITRFVLLSVKESDFPSRLFEL